MYIVGLLVIALVCLALGLVLPSSAWLFASLIATIGAGYLLVRAWRLLGGPGANRSQSDPAPAAARDEALTTVIPAARHEPVPAGAMATTTVIPAVGHEPVPASAMDTTGVISAVTEESETSGDVPIGYLGPAADADDVWVIDGRPRYHLAGCAIIQGQDAEPIPFDQATEDGFMPCSLCEPNLARARH